MDWDRTWALLRRLGPFAEAALVAGIVGWMLHVRMIPYEAFTSACQPACFIGTDPYYHLRAVMVSAANFPSLLRWDPWTRFPDGTETGQFGTFFDLLIAAAVRATGDPHDPVHVARVVARAPAWFGALTAVPIYLIGRRLGGPLAGAWAATVAALLPGEFLIRSMAAYADHHVGEALFSTAAILGVLWAADAGRRLETGIPVWRALTPAAAGALGLFLYLWTWPPGVLVVALLGLWVVVQILVDHLAGDNPRGFAWAMGLTFAGAAVLTLLLVEQRSFAFNLFSLLQPLALAAVALAALALAEGSVRGRQVSLPRWVLPSAAGGLILVVVAAAPALVPSLYGPLKWGFSWITGIGTTANILTIQEARATCDPSESWPFCDTLARSYGLTIYTAILALPLLAYEYARRRRPGDLLLFLWLFLFLVAATNQVRFNYYLAVPLAIANGWLAWWAARTTGLVAAVQTIGQPAPPARRGGRRRVADDTPRFRVHQPAAVAVVLLVAVPGLVDGNSSTIPAEDLAAFFRVDSEVTLWHLGLAWMRENTPPAGVDLKVPYDRPAGAYAYPPGSYGVLSWWDYGHWIQVLGERPPVANPFQQNAPAMSLYFTGTEAQGEALLTKLMHGDPYRARYVMISDADAGGKYGAITVWANQQDPARPRMYQGATVATRDVLVDGQTRSLQALGPAYTESMMSRLYFDNADGLSHYRLVYAYPGTNCYGHYATSEGRVEAFNQPLFTALCPGGPRLERVRTGLPVQGGVVYDFVDAASLKVFEHVRGARITGTGTPGAAVGASLEVAVPVSVGGQLRDASFVYSQSARVGPDGNWTLTVPYSTVDPVPVAEGGTTLLARAVGAYRVTVGGGPVIQVNVPDRAVLEGNEIPLT